MSIINLFILLHTSYSVVYTLTPGRHQAVPEHLLTLGQFFNFFIHLLKRQLNFMPWLGPETI